MRSITKNLTGVLLALVLLALGVSACGSSGGGGTTSGGGTQTTALNIKQTGPGLTEPYTGSGAKIKGGTVTFAEAPGAPPNYIFPMYSAEYCGTNNILGLDALLYRPLYWYGNNYSPSVDYNYSVGQKPIYSNGGKTVTIHLNHFMWSDGEQVTARDLVFWMNVLKANPASEWCEYIPGKFPDNVTSYRAVNPTTFQLTFNKAYNPQWLLYNELPMLTPMPMAWDRTSLSAPAPKADAPNLPDTTKAGAQAVYKMLSTQGTKIDSWSSSPLWSIVDGPWKLQSTTTNGEVTFVPNKAYTGEVKPTISKFVEVPFTSESALVNDLKSQGTSALTIAYIPSQYQPLTSSFKSAGYNVNLASSYAIYMMPLNLEAPKVGKVFQQLYFRQAFQHLVDQPGWIKSFMHGAGVPTLGPVPLAPPSKLVSGSVQTNPYPFSVSDASKILKAHGWKVVPGGQTTCEKPGTDTDECGAGIQRGQGISFNIDYLSDVVATQEEMQDLQSQASKVGIKISLSTHPYADVYAAAAHCTTNQPNCKWTAENWGGGFYYEYYPSGEQLLYSTSVINYSNYKSPEMDKLVNESGTAKPGQEQATMNAYARYAVQQAPVVWLPEAVGDFDAPTAGNLIDSKLGGYTSSAYGELTPEAWYLTK